MSFSVFTALQGHLPGFTKILVGTFQKTAVAFQVMQLEPYMMHLLKSQKLLKDPAKIISMCKIENAPLRDRVKHKISTKCSTLVEAS